MYLSTSNYISLLGSFCDCRRSLDGRSHSVIYAFLSAARHKLFSPYCIRIPFPYGAINRFERKLRNLLGK